MRRMHAGLLALLLSCRVGAQAAHGPAMIELRRGLVITKSSTVARRSYRIPGADSVSGDSAVITIRGHDLTLDLNDATLLGADPASDPDGFTGVAILVDGGKNITIKRGAIHGYRMAIHARGTVNLVIEDTDVGQNWKPRLFSLIEHESLADWLSFHHNENGEWLRFGAGMYLEDVNGGTIRSNRAEQGMNGLMLVRCTHLRIEANRFRFNSGLGIGMYRSSANTIIKNLLDYNVRGFSSGFYSRGQDSADLLMFEQSSNNFVVYNSATHGGDGLFLWAGQSTMDTGAGGSNDNVVYGNNFSFAPANAMEATFSRNKFIENRAEGSDYGFWGGYSYESAVAANCFIRNRVGVAIEHGQGDTITSNQFEGDGTAIRLWGDKVEPGDWNYPKVRNTDSQRETVTSNTFTRTHVGVYVANTRDSKVMRNAFVQVDTVAIMRDTAAMYTDENVVHPHADALWPDPCQSMGQPPPEYGRFAPGRAGNIAQYPESQDTRRDRTAIIVDEWGPYDWRSPKLWPIDSTRAVPLRLGVHGPAGQWRVVARRGIAAVSAMSGAMNKSISVTPRADSLGDWELTLEYRGAEVVTPRGQRIAPGTPVRFSYGRFEPAQDWQLKIFAWTDASDPRSKPQAFNAMMGGAPLMTMRTARLDYMWSRPSLAGVPAAKWALEAASSLELGEGEYTLRTISDDAVRVWVDGKLVIDNWTPHESKVDTAPISAGKHDVRVQYYQVDGWTELRLDVVRGAQSTPVRAPRH